MSLWWAPSTEDPNALPLGPFPGTWRPEDIPEVQVSHMTAYILWIENYLHAPVPVPPEKEMDAPCKIWSRDIFVEFPLKFDAWLLQYCCPWPSPPAQLIHFRRLKCLSSTICAMTQQTAATSSLLPLVLQLQLQLQQLERPGHSTCEAFHIPVVSAISLAISLSLFLYKNKLIIDIQWDHK